MWKQIPKPIKFTIIIWANLKTPYERNYSKEVILRELAVCGIGYLCTLFKQAISWFSLRHFEVEDGSMMHRFVSQNYYLTLKL